MLDHDPVLLAAFFDESLDALEGLEGQIVALPQVGGDLRDAVNAIFRPIHTLKGNAPFFGFLRLQELAHALENELDHLRTGRINPSPQHTNLLLAGLDGLRSAIERLRDGAAEETDEPAFTALLDRFGKAGTPQPAADAWTRLSADLADLELRSALPEPAVLARMRQDLASLRSTKAPAASDERLAHLRRQLERPLSAPLDPTAAQAIVAAVQALRATSTDPVQCSVLDEVLTTCHTFLESVGFDDLLRRHILDAFSRLASAAEVDVHPSPSTGSDVGLERQPQTSTQQQTGTQQNIRSNTEGHGRSMRVSEAAVDEFLAHVGDLLVIGDLMEHLLQRVSTKTDDHGLIRDMRQMAASFSSLSSQLQRSIMVIRRVQVRPLLQKTPRLVRDIAQATGKDIGVVLTGETTELDKGRMELIDGPLTHLVRNCADHGIELPDRRIAAGKPARGTITVTASVIDGWFRLAVADDGKGLDLDAIRRKGEAMGLVRPGADLDEQAIVNLIFASGLSTAEKVSDVSGRGVGMDVVYRQIHEAGGTVTVTTTPGQGTSFTICLPMTATTHIVNAFLVRSDWGVFALPLDLVRESFASDGSDDGHGLMIRHGRTIPILPLGRLLGLESAQVSDADGRKPVVVVERTGHLQALVVDEILGVRRLVARPIDGLTDGPLGRYFQGAALLGDGRLALIIAPKCIDEEHNTP